MSSASGPLAGIRVLDFTRVFAGPHCARQLTDLGADVVKVEPPEGDLARSLPHRVGRLSLYFLNQNAGKRNVSIDLAKPEGAELAAALAERADVVVENYRPGVMARFGLGYPTLAARNPRLVYGSISGYGQTGPWRHRGAYAPVIHAEMGLTDIHARRFGEGQPFEAFSHADVYAALQCTSGILAALYQRESTGVGQHVDVAMAAALLSVNDRVPTELIADQLSSSENLRYDREMAVIVRTDDGRQVVISGEPTNPAVFASYCSAMGRPELAEDARFSEQPARERHREELVEIIQEWVHGFEDLDSLEAVLRSIRLPLGRVRTVKEAAESDWALQSAAFVEVTDRQGGTARIPQSPWRFSGAVAGIRGSAAFPGEHNAVVCRELLGLSDEEVAVLESSGVLRSRLPREMNPEVIPSPQMAGPPPVREQDGASTTG